MRNKKDVSALKYITVICGKQAVFIDFVMAFGYCNTGMEKKGFTHCKGFRIIAFDLDGTLLRNDKTLSGKNLEALYYADARGIELVPATGRMLSAIPDCIRLLPFIHYAITINGAVVFDLLKNLEISREEIPVERALEICAVLDQYPVIYDCYCNNSGYMTKSMKERASDFVDSGPYLKMIADLRKPVPDLKEFIRKNGQNLQKIQLFSKDDSVRGAIMKEIGEKFPDLALSSSIAQNIEINSEHAVKGEALLRLAEYLACPMEQIMAIGDGSNDISMIRAAGMGVTLENGRTELKEIADYVTRSNEEDGVAEAIYRFCGSEK